MGPSHMKILKEGEKDKEWYIYLLLPQAFLISASDTLLLESSATRNNCLQGKKCPDTNTWRLSGKGGKRGRDLVFIEQLLFIKQCAGHFATARGGDGVIVFLFHMRKLKLMVT